jgi:hypothetical protein
MSLNLAPNFAQGYNFEIVIPSLPVVSALAQDFLIPALTLNPVEVPNRFQDYTLAGEKLLYGEIDIGFIMDVQMDAYVEIHNWMKLMAGAYDQVAEERRLLHNDITLQLLNNHKHLVRTFKFIDAWPTSLGAASYDLATAGQVKSILTLKFSAFTITPNTTSQGGLTDPSPDIP